jgi:hypothetical protein
MVGRDGGGSSRGEFYFYICEKTKENTRRCMDKRDAGNDARGEALVEMILFVLCLLTTLVWLHDVTDHKPRTKIPLVRTVSSLYVHDGLRFSPRIVLFLNALSRVLYESLIS